MDRILTIIIPAYNMEKYLGRCLSSLIVDEAQLQMFEALVINDGSKDKTSEIGHQFEAKYPGTFRVIDKENGHYGSCINTGLKQALGKYVKILDADDYYAAGFSQYLSFLKETEADLILTNSVSVEENYRILSITTFPLPPREPVSIRQMNDCGVVHLDHFNIAWKTEILKRMEYIQTEGISYTDLEWSTLPASRITSTAYFPEVVYCYLRGRAGQSVDIGYRKNNMWMEDKVVLGIATQYESIKSVIPPENATLLRALASYLVRQVYFHYLINFPHQLDEGGLATFDRALFNSCKTLYDSVSEEKDIRKFGTFHYIRDFRKKGTRKTLKYAIFDAFVAIGSLRKVSDRQRQD